MRKQAVSTNSPQISQNLMESTGDDVEFSVVSLLISGKFNTYSFEISTNIKCRIMKRGGG